MIRIKMQKGITIIALIITIAVLLVLAVVTINSLDGYEIIKQAENGVGIYEDLSKEHNTSLDEYKNYLKDEVR